MRKAMIIVTLFCYTLTALVPSVITADLCKVANLWRHFQQHQTENPMISVADFLVLHYSNEYQKHQQQSQHNHQNLPFKNHQHYATNTLSVVQMLAQTVELSKPVYSAVHQQNFVLINHFVPSQHLSDIWHPPKCC
jgi:hypothetical protein